MSLLVAQFGTTDSFSVKEELFGVAWSVLWVNVQLFTKLQQQTTATTGTVAALR
jgi:hypothetical protein